MEPLCDFPAIHHPPDPFNPVMNFPAVDYTRLSNSYGNQTELTFGSVLVAAFLIPNLRAVGGNMLNNWENRLPSDIDRVLFYAQFGTLYGALEQSALFGILNITIPASVTNDNPSFAYNMPTVGEGFTINNLKPGSIRDLKRNDRIDIGTVFINPTEDTDNASRLEAIGSKGMIIKSYNLDENAIRGYGWGAEITDMSALPTIISGNTFILPTQTYGVDANLRRPKRITIPSSGYSADTNNRFILILPKVDAPLTISHMVLGQLELLYDRNHPVNHNMTSFDITLGSLEYTVIHSRIAQNDLSGIELILRYQ